MAKFCTNCGKKLEEGGVCDCQKNKENINHQITIADYGRQIMDITKRMLTKPIDTMKSFIGEKSFTNGVIMLCITCIILSLFVIACIKQGMGINYSGVSLGSLMSGMNVDIPYAKIFFTILIALLIIYFLLAFSLHIVNVNIFHGTGSFKKMTSVVGISLLPITVLGLVAIVFTFIYMPIATLALIIGTMLSNYYLYSGLKFATNIDENKHAYLMVSSYIVVMVVLFIVSKILN